MKEEEGKGHSVMTEFRPFYVSPTSKRYAESEYLL
jgi:hypothetical protein